MTAEANHDASAAPGDGKVVALFHATRCPYCRVFAPVFRRLATAADDGGFQPLEVLLDDDEDPRWQRFGIEAVPTVIFFDGAEVKARLDARVGIGITEAELATALARIR